MTDINELLARWTTVGRMKMQDAQIRIVVMKAGQPRPFFVGGWIGESGIPCAEWFGEGARWSYNTSQTWRRPLMPSVALEELRGGTVHIDFRSPVPLDGWSFTPFTLHAKGPSGEMQLVGPTDTPIGHPENTGVKGVSSGRPHIAFAMR